MDLRVEQGCPQCGARIVLAETDRLLTCSYCGVRNYLQATGPFRYVLPLAKPVRQPLLLAPYLRFKGTIFLVTGEEISHRVVDTTLAGNGLPWLPPSLGVRPQAMQLRRIDRDAETRYLPLTLKANAVLEKAIAISSLSARAGHDLYHRAYIGESLSCIYLPIERKSRGLFDSVTGTQLVGPEELQAVSVQGKPFHDSWQVRFLASLCPQCGATMDGAPDCQVMTCAICHSAWGFGSEGLERVEWHVVPGSQTTGCYLPFWKITTQVPALKIYSYADFVEQTNQPYLPRPGWRERPFSLWIPAIKLRPKIFLQAGRQATLAQGQVAPAEGRRVSNLFPVTLPAGEARQAAKVILAASTTSPRLVFPFLPQVQLTEVVTQLVYLPFIDKGHDWLQPETGVVIGKNILQFGRAM